MRSSLAARIARRSSHGQSSFMSPLFPSSIFSSRFLSTYSLHNSPLQTVSCATPPTPLTASTARHRRFLHSSPAHNQEEKRGLSQDAGADLELQFMESPLHDGKQVPLQPGNQTLPRDEHGNVAIQDSTFVEDDPDDLMESVFILEKPDSTGAIVWLHGLGRSVETERPVFEMIAPSHLTFYVPNASKMPITVLEDAEERAWYDVEHEVFSDDNDEDEFNIEDSARRIKDLLDKVCERFPPEKVVLGGFAQGGAMALHVGLSYEKKLAGIVSFSGYLVMPEYYPEHISEEARDTPVLAVHGNSDMAIPLEFAENRYSHLEEEGLDFEFRQDFYMGHFMGNESLLSTQGWMIDAIDRN